MMKPIEAKKDAEVSHESSTMAPLPTVNEEGPSNEKPQEGEHKEPMANSSEQGKTVEEGEKSAGTETKEEEAEQEPPQPAIVFPASHQQQSTTTEESAVIAGDKSVFDRTQEEAERMPGPEQAHIQHMSHEGEHEVRKEWELKRQLMFECLIFRNPKAKRTSMNPLRRPAPNCLRLKPELLASCRSIPKRKNLRRRRNIQRRQMRAAVDLS
jgi:hypothetical protein